MNAADLTKVNISPALPLAVGDIEAARLLSVSTRTLFNWRADGSGPRWVKIGGRVLYPVDGMRRWLAEISDPANSGKSPAEQAISTPATTPTADSEKPAKQAIGGGRGGAE